MSEGVADTPELSAETQRLAELGKQGDVELRDPLAPKLTPAPEGIPEKFWDPLEGKLRTDDLLKSYTELEKMRGQKPEETAEVSEEKPEGDTAAETEQKPEGEAEEKPEGETEEKPEGEVEQTPALTDAIETAKAAYAETGELNEDARKPLLDAGITNEQIDLYLQGVKATEQALYGAAYEEAGDEATYKEAVAWAKDNWTPQQIALFNNATGDPSTIRTVVKGLMADFNAANPGEGRLTSVNSGANLGDVYRDIAEFHRDLAESDKTRDQLARKTAIEKLSRSRASKSIK